MVHPINQTIIGAVDVTRSPPMVYGVIYQIFIIQADYGAVVRGEIIVNKLNFGFFQNFVDLFDGSKRNISLF